ncbi:MAG: MMPL family transporter [Burkholderiaceae bacterium]
MSTLAALVIWLALCFVAIVTLAGVPVRQDLTQFMPTGADSRQREAVALLRDGPASRLVMIAIEGGTARERADASRALAARLRGDARFAEVANGAFDGDRDALRSLFDYRYLLIGGKPDRFGIPALREALSARLQEMSAAIPMTDARQTASDPTAAFRRWLLGLQPPAQPPLAEGAWADPVHGRALLIARTAESGLDAEQQQGVVDAIARAFTADAPVATLRLRLGGNPVYAAQSRDSIRAQLTALSAAAGLFVTGLLWLGYRSLRLAVLAALPLASAGLAGAAVVALFFGQIHGITLVFGITLIGVAIDYPIHLFSHLGPTHDPRTTMIRLWPTLRLGAITTAIGYLAFARSDFAGLAQLGTFAASGLLAAAAVTRWLLPGLIAAADTRAPGPTLLRLADPLLSLSRRGSTTILTVMIAAGALLWLVAPPRWETDLRALSPLSTAQRQLAGEMQRALGGHEPGRLIVVRADTAQAALERSEALLAPLEDARKLGLIGAFDLAARHLPSPALQRARRDALPDTERLAAALDEAASGLPFKRDAFAPFLAAVERSRTLAPLTLEQALQTPLGQRLRPLLGQAGGQAMALVVLNDVRDPPGFERWWHQQTLADATLMDLPAISGQILDEFRDSTLQRWMIGLLAIGLAIAIGRRSWSAALTALLPTLLGAATTIGVIGALGQPLTLFHLIALLLTVGIAIDYNLFFQRPAAGRDERLATIHALTLCALSSASVFAILAVSPTPILRAIGLTVAIGVALSLVFALACARLLTPPST